MALFFNSKKKNKEEKWNIRTMFGPNMNFAATEAYKLLRTNLIFSFPDDDQCRVVGITSSVQSEGKSSTATVRSVRRSSATREARILSCVTFGL